MSETFDNPVLPGFSPDPSVCRVGEDYYLVTSTFEYFPGLPLWHSRDLVHWRRLGHVLDRPSQLDLDGIVSSEGLYAPTIRHHDGVWYVVCTMINGLRHSGHFLVTADDPAGAWSEPLWLAGGGFDPSLFFDDDGRCWFHATRDATGHGGAEIWLRELDLARGELVGPEHVIWRGALAEAVWSEGPHLYRKDGWYHLIAAEGGTERWHCVVAARSREITGPYQGSPANPVLTHRHLGVNADIGCVGHADLVDTPDGRWWATVLGVRQGGVEVLGRETFLVPVEWQDDWPVFAPEVGRVRPRERAPELPAVEWGPGDEAPDEFEGPSLDGRWSFLRTPRRELYSLTDRPGWLRLRPNPARLGDLATPSLLLCRQRYPEAEATALVELAGASCEGALVALRDQGHHYRLELFDGEARVVRTERGGEQVLARTAAPEGPVELRLRCVGGRYHFALRRDDGWFELADGDARLLSGEVAGRFTGTMLGLYATGPAGHLDVSRFEQRPLG